MGRLEAALPLWQRLAAAACPGQPLLEIIGCWLPALAAHLPNIHDTCLLYEVALLLLCPAFAFASAFIFLAIAFVIAAMPLLHFLDDSAPVATAAGGGAALASSSLF